MSHVIAPFLYPKCVISSKNRSKNSTPKPRPFRTMKPSSGHLKGSHSRETTQPRKVSREQKCLIIYDFRLVKHNLIMYIWWIGVGRNAQTVAGNDAANMQ